MGIDDTLTHDGEVVVHTAIEESRPPMETVLKGLAAINGIALRELKPLYQRIETEALNELMSTQTGTIATLASNSYSIRIRSSSTVTKTYVSTTEIRWPN